MSDILYLLFKLLKKSRLSGSRHSSLHHTSKLESGTSLFRTSIGKYSYCGYDCDVSHADIGSFVSIANGVVIGGGRHPMEWVGMSPVFYAGRDSVTKKFSVHPRDPVKRVSIGHDVWIGRSAIILPGVTIGNGAVIGAGSVVTKPVPSYAIFAGNPARLIRYRFDEDTILRLNKIQWWAMEEAKLQELAQFFKDVNTFLKAAEDLK